MKKSISGFTIVELAIVIVVIGILASIGIVAYNGSIQRAQNSQTLSAVSQWAKSLMVYRARTGSLPSMSSCLGTNYKFGDAGTATSGTAQCRQDSGGTVLYSTAFRSALTKYMVNEVSPAMVTARNSTSVWYRGANYFVDGAGTSSIGFVLNKGATCPSSLADFRLTTSVTASNANIYCTYSLGQTNAYAMLN